MKLAPLAETLHNVVTKQTRDVRRAIVGEGDFSLDSKFKHFSVTPADWETWTSNRKERHLLKFLKTCVVLKDVIRPSNEEVCPVVAPRGWGKKPCQRKRRCNAKTMSISKKKLKKGDVNNDMNDEDNDS